MSYAYIDFVDLRAVTISFDYKFLLLFPEVKNERQPIAFLTLERFFPSYSTLTFDHSFAIVQNDVRKLLELKSSNNNIVLYYFNSSNI